MRSFQTAGYQNPMPFRALLRLLGKTPDVTLPAMYWIFRGSPGNRRCER